MFGNGRKRADSATEVEANADVGEGELILEELFTDERPEPAGRARPAAAKPTVDAEDAEFVEVVRDPQAKAQRAPQKRKKSRSKAKARRADGSVISRLFAQPRGAGQPEAAPSNDPPEALDLAGEGADTQQPPSTKDAVGGPGEHESRRPARSSAVKPGRARAGRRARAQATYLVSQIGGDRSIYWKLTKDGIVSVDALPANARAISFSNEDLRYETDHRMGHRAAEELVLQEVGDAVHFINRSKDLKAVYATLRERVEALTYRVGPGALLLDRLAQQRAPDADALIVGLELKDTSGRDALLILYYLSATGRSSEPQVSVYPDNRDFLLSQFASTHQASRDNARVLMLDHAALHEAAAKLELYPSEANLAGIPLRKLWLQAAAAGVVAAAAAGAWAYQAQLEVEQARRKLASAQSSAEMVQRAATELLSTSPRALAQGLSLDLETVLGRSHQLWVPGSRIQLTADGTGAEYLISAPLIPAARATAQRVNSHVIEALLHLPVPDGCESSPLNFAGTFNEAQLYLRCEAPPHPLDRYRDR